MRTDPVIPDDLRARPRVAGATTAGPRSHLRRRVLSWRLWALVALATIDGIFFVIPLVPAGLIVCAVIAPDLLRRIARFLDALATGA